MYKLVILVLLPFFTTATFSQQTDPVPSLTKQDYLEKSKNQKKTAKIFLGGGAVLVVTAFIIPRGERTGTTRVIYSDYENDGIKAAFGLAGFVSMAASIPFFIASGKNKRKAMSMSFRFQQLPQRQNASLVNEQVPSFVFKINL